MADVSLFRKFRSATFSDLVGQESVVRTLGNVLAGGSPSRAYLFCGPRGTGKTSTARIFAKALCCPHRQGLEPCDRCSICRDIGAGSCMDVFEIDAASHTQVEKIRDFIVDKVHFAPAQARYKVYIIDEVHKLSTASFNALLKTLEEPPAHVVFILATTHPHEILPTILSRCQRYDFRPLTVAEIRSRLEHVAREEQLQLEPEAATTLARAADGSLRDALVLLEQALGYCGPNIRLTEVESLLGLVAFDTQERFLQAMSRRDTRALLSLLHDLAGAGQDLSRFCQSLTEHLRALMLLRAQADDSTIDSFSESVRQSLAGLAEQVSLGQVLQWLKATMELAQAIRDGGPPRLLWEMLVVQVTSAEAASPAGGASPGLEALSGRLDRLERRLSAEAPAAKPAAALSSPAQGASQVASATPGAPGAPPTATAHESASSAAAPPVSARESAPRSVPAPATAGESIPSSAAPAAPARETAPRSAPPPATARESIPSSAAPPASARESAPRSVPPPATARESIPSSAAPPASARENVPGPAAPPASDPESAPGSAQDQGPAPTRASTPRPAPSQNAAPPAPGQGADAYRRPTPRREPSGATPPSGSPSKAAQPGPVDATAREFWGQMMNEVKVRDKRIHGVMADARLVHLGQAELVLNLPQNHNWHLEQIMGARGMLEEVAQQVLGRQVALECRIDAGRAQPSGPEEHKALVQRASGLFSGKILEE